MKKFYDTLTKSFSYFENENTIPESDPRVSAFFKAIPAGKVLSFDENGLPLIIDYVEPVKTFDQELDSLNSKYDSDFTDLVSEYNMAVARDGVTESVKVDTVRSKMTTLDSEYDDAFMALLIKHS